jgi:hypothetical protein
MQVSARGGVEISEKKVYRQARYCSETQTHAAGATFPIHRTMQF